MAFTELIICEVIYICYYISVCQQGLSNEVLMRSWISDDFYVISNYLGLCVEEAQVLLMQLLIHNY